MKTEYIRNNLKRKKNYVENKLFYLLPLTKSMVGGRGMVFLGYFIRTFLSDFQGEEG